MAHIVNTDDFVSKHGKSKHQLWNELCELISKNPTKVRLEQSISSLLYCMFHFVMGLSFLKLNFRSLNVEAIIRGGLRRYTDQLGHLWNSLADYYVRSGLFERVKINFKLI